MNAVSSQEDSFNALQEALFNQMIMNDPVLASSMGIHQFDDDLPNGSRENYINEIIIRDGFLSKLESFNLNDLSLEKSIDCELAIYGLKLQKFEDNVLEFWESFPSSVNTIGDSLFQLLIRDFAPFESRLKSIVERIEKSPIFLESSKSRLRKPIKIWLEITIESTMNLPALLDSIASTARYNNLGSSRLFQAIEELSKYLIEYRHWLRDEMMLNASDEFAIGLGVTRLTV